jgi:hypothetical protein
VVWICFPWCFVLLALFRQWAGVNWNHLRSNASLIASIDRSDNQGPWLWSELADRLKSGRLTKPEAGKAIDQVIAYVQHQHTGGPLFWSDSFLVPAETGGDISNSQYLAMAQAFYPPGPTVDCPDSIPASSQSWFQTNWGSGWDLPGLSHVLYVQQLLLSPKDPAANTAAPTSVSLLMPAANQLAPPDVPPGSYTLKCVIRFCLMSGPGSGFGAVTTSPPGGAPPLAQWTSTVVKQVEITAALPRYRAPLTSAQVSLIQPAYSGQPSSPPLILRSDLASDPQQDHALTAPSAEALCYTDATLLTVHLQTDLLPVNCFFKQTIIAAGQSYDAGSRLYWHGTRSQTAITGWRMQRFPSEVKSVDLKLTPDIEAAKSSQIDQIWVEPVALTDIPLTYRQMNVSYSHWGMEKDSQNSR